MSTNNSQIGNSPSEGLIENNDNLSSMDQLLSVELVMTNHELIPFTMANMIPSQIPRVSNHQEHHPVIRRQHARRGRQQQWQQRQRQQQQQQENRRRRNQRQRERRQQRRLERPQEQEQQRQRREQQLQEQRQQRQRREQQLQEQRQQRQRREQQLQEQRPLYQWLPRREQHREIQSQGDGELIPEDFDDVRHQYPELFEESFDEIFNEIQLEIYDWEKMDPKERSEQEQINEIERTTTREQEEINRDYIEQLNQIAAMEQSQERTIQQRHTNELILLEQWELHELWHQQMPEN